MLVRYLEHRRTFGNKRGPLFLSQSRRNYSDPISIWSGSKIVLQIARRAGVERFSTHTLRHLCLIDLARAGWDIHEIASFAGHRSVQTSIRFRQEVIARLTLGVPPEWARLCRLWFDRTQSYYFLLTWAVGSVMYIQRFYHQAIGRAILQRNSSPSSVSGMVETGEASIPFILEAEARYSPQALARAAPPRCGSSFGIFRSGT